MGRREDGVCRVNVHKEGLIVDRAIEEGNRKVSLLGAHVSRSRSGTYSHTKRDGVNIGNLDQNGRVPGDAYIGPCIGHRSGRARGVYVGGSRSETNDINREGRRAGGEVSGVVHDSHGVREHWHKSEQRGPVWKSGGECRWSWRQPS